MVVTRGEKRGLHFLYSARASTGFLGRVCALKEFLSLAAETLHRLQTINDEAFGRGGATPV